MKALLVSLLAVVTGISSLNGEIGRLHIEKIKLPPGFKIKVFSDKVPGARSMALGKKGTLFVGTRGEGKVYAVTRGDVKKIASGLNMPNGVAFNEKSLYVAEVDRILRYDDIEDRLDNPPEPTVVNDSFPRDKWHGWKYIAFGPDGKLYVPIGAPCNVCISKDQRFATITRINRDGSGFEIFARGVRNTVGFDWHPDTNILWFTDNGRDWLGENSPPDELNEAWEKGLHFGFPFIHGKNISDPEFWGKAPPVKFVPPEAELGPHAAALGMKFYTGRMFPEEYRNQVFIAEHGSWNRIVPAGYRISIVRFKRQKPATYEIFAEGWLSGGEAWGRPVDILIMTDGSMLVSDDKAGAIYRISYENNRR